jgi:lysophospholipase L1-like esterase
MTLFGQYLARLPAALGAEAPNAPIRLIVRGLRGCGTFMAAFRVADDVLPLVPDLVLIEFAHNDGTSDAVVEIGRSVDAMIARIRQVNPACEFAFVYLAPAGTAAGGPTAAMRAYERTADYYGTPSFDLASLSEQLVAAKTVSWTGDGAPALTSDGIHHTALAEDVLGAPFAAAFVRLLCASGSLPETAPRPVRDRSLSGAWRAPASRYLGTGSWAVGFPHNHDGRNAQAYEDEVAEALAPEATLVVPFEGARLLMWAVGSGTIRWNFEGRPGHEVLDIRSGRWQIHSITASPPVGRHVLRVTVMAAPIVFGDIYVVGPPLLW